MGTTYKDILARSNPQSSYKKYGVGGGAHAKGYSHRYRDLQKTKLTAVVTTALGDKKAKHFCKGCSRKMFIDNKFCYRCTASAKSNF